MKQVPAKWKKRFQEPLILLMVMVVSNEDFRLFSTNNQSGELTYQRFLNGYPTFNKEGANQIQVTWGEKASLIIVVRYCVPMLC